MARICRIVKLLVVPLISIIVATDSVLLQSAGAAYRGKYLGPLTSRKHSVSGHVYAVDSRTLHLQGFNYDGTGPDAFFWVGFTDSPSPQGIIVPNERGTKEVLTAYNNADITISLPDGLTLRDIKWFAVWCRAYEVNFGDIYIPPNFDYPQPHVVGSILGQGVSSGPIVVVDAQTILVPDFTFDGQAPDLHFWVGRGAPGPDGIRVPDETGTDAGLAKSDKKTLVLSLPGDLTIFDIDYFGVYSRAYNIDYGHVRITPGLNVPPSLRMLGISPQTRLNCEVLDDEHALEIRWSVVGSGETIVFQLVGRIDDGNYMSFGLSGETDRSVMLGGDVVVGWLDQVTGRGHVTDYYLERKSVCIGNAGACPDVHWKEGTNNVRMLSAASVNGFTILTYQRKLGAADVYDKTILTNGSQPVIWAVGPIKNGEAQYHFLRNKDDLSIDFGRVPKWNCPQPEGEPEASPNAPSPATYLLQQSTHSIIDEEGKGSSGSGSNGAVTTIRATTTTVPTTTTVAATTRTTMTTTTEKPPRTTVPSTAAAAASTFPKNSGAQAEDGNHIAEYKAPATAPSPTSWQVPPIPCYEPDDRVYYAQLGPTGGTYGYKSITGRQDKPQEAWYINGLLLPEIYLVRNLNYTFVIQGGDNPDVTSDYNPFYITDDPEGGHEAKSLIERQGVKVYAGVEYDSRGRDTATAVGKLCRWLENGNQPADFFSSYAAYQRSLFLNCDKGHSGILHFTPNEDTPDLLYYQSYTKRHLGWKIHVVDDCSQPSESKVDPARVIEGERQHASADALKTSESNGTPIIQQHESQLRLLNAQTRNPDQRPGETVNHPSNILPHHHPLLTIGEESKTSLNSQSSAIISPISGLGSGRPLENAYLFAAGSNPTGLSQLGLPTNLKTSQFIQQQQHHHQQPQQQMPSIISLDPSRFDANGVPVAHHGIAQYAQLQGHTVVSVPTQPDAFHFPHHPNNNAAFFQVAAMDGVGGASAAGGSATSGVSVGNRVQTAAGTAFPAQTFQLAGPLAEGHLMRRTGPQQQPQQQFSPSLQLAQQQQQQQHHHHHQQQQQGVPLNHQFKFTKVVSDRSEAMPEFYLGANRAPLLSHPIRYDGIPMNSLVYASTGSPISRVTGNPISSFLMAQQQQQQQHSQVDKHHIHPHHPQFAELTAAAGQNPIVRIRSEIGAPNGGVMDGVKYLEISGTPTATAHNIHIMDAAQASRIAPVTGTGAPPSTWTQARNLPKREQKHPYFFISKERSPHHSARLNRQSTRAAMKSFGSGGGSITGREIRANDNLYETEKMDEPTNSHSQSSIQRSESGKVVPEEVQQQQDTSASSSTSRVAPSDEQFVLLVTNNSHVENKTGAGLLLKPSSECNASSEDSSTCKLVSASDNPATPSQLNAQLKRQQQQQPLQDSASTLQQPDNNVTATTSTDKDLQQQISQVDDKQQELIETSSTQRKLHVVQVRRQGGPTRNDRLSTFSSPINSQGVLRVAVGTISGMMNGENGRSINTNNNINNNNNSNDRSGISITTAVAAPATSTASTNNDNGDDYGSDEMIKTREKNGELMITSFGSGGGNNNGTIMDSTTAAASNVFTVRTSIFPTAVFSTTPSSGSGGNIDVDGGRSSNGVGGNNIHNNNKVGDLVSKPVYETFSPVFRPSPLDIDAFNVSMNFETGHNNHLDQKQQQQYNNKYNHHHQHSRQLQGSGRNMVYSEGLLFSKQPSISSSSSSSSASTYYPPLSPQGLQGHFHPDDDFISSWEKRKFRQHPQLLANIGNTIGSQGGEPLSTSKSEQIQKALRFAGASPPYASPAAGTAAHFHDAIKLFNWQRERYHHQQKHHHHPFGWQQQQRLHHQHNANPPFSMFPIPSSSRQRINFNGPPPSNRHPPLPHHHHSHEEPVSAFSSRHDKVSEHHHYLSSSPSSIATPTPTKMSGVSSGDMLNANQEETSEKMLVLKNQFHTLLEQLDQDHRNKQIVNSSSSSIRSPYLSTRSGESVSEKGTTTPKLTRASSSGTSSTSSSTAAAAPHYTRRASAAQENLIRMEEESAAASASSRKRNLIGWSKFAERNSTDVVTPITTTTTTSTTTTVYTSDLAEKNNVEGGQDKARDDRTKTSEGSGEEEGGSPDPLSLTLLTDIWQTINQDNGSKTPSQKPPAVAPLPHQQPTSKKSISASPLQQASSSVVQVTSPSAPAASSTQHHHQQRYGFQRVHGNRQTPPRMWLPNASAGSGGPLRNRLPPHMRYPMRRQHTYHPHPSSSAAASASLHFPQSLHIRQQASLRPIV